MAWTFTLKVVTNGTPLMLLLCWLLVFQGVSGCAFGRHGCFHEKAAQSSRKMLQAAGLEVKNEVLKGVSFHGSSPSSASFVGGGWELRAVPSGPDPLHHNGGSPKKPRTDP